MMCVMHVLCVTAIVQHRTLVVVRFLSLSFCCFSRGAMIAGGLSHHHDHDVDDYDDDDGDFAETLVAMCTPGPAFASFPRKKVGGAKGKE